MDMMLGRLWIQTAGTQRAFPATLDCQRAEIWVEEEALDGLMSWMQEHLTAGYATSFEPQGSTERLPVHYEPGHLLGKVDKTLLASRLQQG